MSQGKLAGLLLVDKPTGCTSHDVVQRARRALRERRVGHCGTLDPGATGLLLLTVGKATRLTRFLIEAPKTYEGDVEFGVSTDTYDALGKVVEQKPIDDLTADRIVEAMTGFRGTYEQIAPAFSAKKVGGRKYYELARKGEEVPEAHKEITVFSLEATSDLDEGRIGIRLECSSGTYVRSLAHDLGVETGFGAHLASLRRTRVGPFDVDDAVDLERLSGLEDPTEGSWWIPFHQIRLPFEELTVDGGQAERISHGQTILVRELEGEEGDWIKVVDARRQFIAVGTVSERISSGVGIVQPRIVFS